MGSLSHSPLRSFRHYHRLTEEQKIMGLTLAGVGVASVDYVADTIVLDPIAADIFGLPADVAIGRAEFHNRVHPNDWPQVAGEVDKLLDPAFDDVIEVTHRAISTDGATRWVHARKRLYRAGGPGSAIRTGTAAIRDITAEVEARERSELALSELGHRTRNLATVVSAVAEQTMRTGAPETFLDRFLPRLANLADQRDILSPAQGSGLRETVDRVLARFAGASEGRWTVDGPEVALDPAAAQTFSMVLHELATNAVKYGALKRLDGLVEISWSMNTERLLTFRWRETGGPPVITPTGEGFGGRVLTRYPAITLSARSEMVFDPNGFGYTLQVPARS